MLHAQYRLSLLQWNAGAARRQPTPLVTAMCGAFNAVLLPEAADHVPHVSDQFSTYTDGNNLAILLNKETFLPNADKYPIAEESTSKNTWGLTALVVRRHLRRPPVGAPKTVTLCSVHLHNVIAKKCDAATSLLQRLYAHMKMLDVDFIGGDFNMAVRGPVADVFSDAEFMGPVSIPLWRAGVRHWTIRTARASYVCSSARSTGLSKTTGFTHSKTPNWDAMSEMRILTTQSLCTFGQPTSRAAPVPLYAATQLKRGGT